MIPIHRLIRDTKSPLPLKTLRIGAMATVLLACTAHAEEKPQAFGMTTYSNGPGGQSLAQGEYLAAIEEIGQYRPALEEDPTVIHTNLCVAYSLTRQWKAARQSCDIAIREARASKVSAPTWKMGAAVQRDYLALAYANRAVLHWMMHNPSGAATDLAMATKLAPKADFVERNMAALNARSTAAAQVPARIAPSG